MKSPGCWASGRFLPAGRSGLLSAVGILRSRPQRGSPLQGENHSPAASCDSRQEAWAKSSPPPLPKRQREPESAPFPPPPPHHPGQVLQCSRCSELAYMSCPLSSTWSPHPPPECGHRALSLLSCSPEVLRPCTNTRTELSRGGRWMNG